MIKATINGVSYEYCKDCEVYHKAMKKKIGCTHKVLVKSL